MADTRPQWTKSIVEPVVAPGDMRLDEWAFTGREHMRELFGKMTDEQRQRFIDGILVALWEAQDHDDLRPIVNETTAWFATLLLTTQPDWEEKRRRIEELRGTGPTYTVEDLRARLAEAEGQIARESGE